MKLLIQWALIFFGTLMVAALVALGEPARCAGWVSESEAAAKNQLLQSVGTWIKEARRSSSCR